MHHCLKLKDERCGRPKIITLDSDPMGNSQVSEVSRYVQTVVQLHWLQPRLQFAMPCSCPNIINITSYLLKPGMYNFGK